MSATSLLLPDRVLLPTLIVMSTVETITQALPSLALRNPQSETEKKQEEPYKYTEFLPVFPKDEHYPPLTPFEHVDPGHRALTHPNPRAFLDNATSVIEITPRLGTEVRGVNLAQLDSDGRDQLALEVSSNAKDLLIHDAPCHCPSLPAWLTWDNNRLPGGGL